MSSITPSSTALTSTTSSAIWTTLRPETGKTGNHGTSGMRRVSSRARQLSSGDASEAGRGHSRKRLCAVPRTAPFGKKRRIFIKPRDHGDVRPLRFAVLCAGRVRPETCVSVDVAENKLLARGFEGRSPSSSTTMFPAASSRRTPLSGRTAPPAASLFSRSSMRWSAGPDKTGGRPSLYRRLHRHGLASATRTPTAPRSAPPRAFATPGRICRCSTRSFSAPSPRRGSRSRAWCAPRPLLPRSRDQYCRHYA